MSKISKDKKSSKQMKQDDKQDDNSKVKIPVMRIKPMSVNHARCGFVDAIGEDERTADELIDIPDNNLTTIGEYTLNIVAKRCNVVSTYILNNSKIPVYALTVAYSKSFIVGQLFTLYIFFDMEKESREKLIKSQVIKNQLVKGKYTIELFSEDGLLTSVLERRKKELVDEILLEYIQTQNENEVNMESFMESIDSKIETKLDQYRDLYKPIEFTEDDSISQNRMLNRLTKMFQTNIYKEYMKACLDIQDEKRREKYGVNDNMKPPKKVISLKELKEDPSKIDDIVDNLSDYMSDEEDD